ncbi:MAG: Rieske (2Fe-2S) protein [Vulcanimicrobiaceae bacterium]
MSLDNPARPATAGYVRVSSVAAIPPGRSRAFDVGRYEVAVFNVGGTFYATENACPHQGGPIAEGTLDGEEVTCPWHAWTFNVTTGKMRIGDFTMLARFDVRIEGHDVLVSTVPMAES